MTMLLHKAKAQEKRRLRQVLAENERFVFRQFAAFVQALRGKAFQRRIQPLLEERNVDAILKLVDEQIDKMGAAIVASFIDVARLESKALTRRAKIRTDGRLVIKADRVDRTPAEPSVGFNFDPTDAATVARMARNKLKFVVEFTRQQRLVTRQALTAGIEQGLGTVELAKTFKNSIGLTQAQQSAVDSYARALASGSADALSRELRDRRYDSLVQRVVNEGEVLSTSQIESMVGRYTDNFLQLRAETIARTESLRIVNEAQDDAFRQAMGLSDIEEGEVEKEWVSTLDGRTRDSHVEMNGQVVPYDEPFETPSGQKLMYPGDESLGAGPEEIINCRCVMLRHVKPKDE